MTLLEEFIFSLSKAGRSKLRPLQFRGPKRKIFFSVLECRTRGGIDSEVIIKRYKLTQKRYYQILSEILSSCYHDLVPKGGTALLQFLGNKQLFRHLYNEMRKQETGLLAKRNKKELEQYYYRMLILKNLFLLHRDFNAEVVKEFDAYAERYLAIKEPHPHDDHFRKIAEIRNHLDSPRRRVNLDKMINSVNELENIFGQIKDGDHFLAQFTVNDSLLLFFSRFHIEGKSPKIFAEYGIRLMENQPDIFAPIKDFYELECFQFLNPDRTMILERFKHFLLENSNAFGSSSYYIGRFLTPIIRNGDLAWAKKYIDKYFPYNIDLLHKDLSLNYWYILMIFHVYEGNFVDGDQYVQQAFAANSGKNRNVDLDIIFRCYDVFFTAMKGDPIAVENTIARHIRYAHTHGHLGKQTYQIIFLKAISDLMKYANFDSSKAEKIKNKFFESSGAERLSFLFQMIYEKYF